MANLLRRLWPQSQVHWLLGRVGSRLAPPRTVAGIQVDAVAATDKPQAQALDAFASDNGFPQGWAGEMVADGASVIVARDLASSGIVAMAWWTSRPFHVEEIAAMLDPRGGVYLFGDFVATAYRGRGIQQLLVAERLRAAGEAAHACTLVHPSNKASVRSYEAEGFEVGGQFIRSRWMGRTWARCRASRTSRIQFTLEGSETIVARLSPEIRPQAPHRERQ
jgi:ribosomal protein S18 acetylase RimI-like enzyme